MDQWFEIFFPFLSALAAGIISITLLLRHWRFEKGKDSYDGIRKFQKEPVLRVAGLSLFLSFCIGCVIVGLGDANLPENSPAGAFLILGTIMFAIGFLDDLFGVPAFVRLLVQIAVGVAAYLSGMSIELVTNPFTGESAPLGSFGLVFTVLWFVAVPNLINLVDGMDGIAGGIGLFLSLTLAILGFLTSNVALLIMSTAMAGGLVAFLRFNLPPAKVYMGDGGAYLLGYFIAATSLVTSNKGSIFGALLVVIVALGFPILDTAFAIIRRFLSGLPLLRPDARHLHHRMMMLGFSKRTILLFLYGVFAAFCILGLSIYFSSGHSIPIVGMIITVAIFSGMRKLGVPHTFTEIREHLREVITSRKDTRYAYNLSQVLEHEVERIARGEEFWNELHRALVKVQLRPVAKEDGDLSSRDSDRCLIVQSLPENRVWKMSCPSSSGSRRHWHRVLSCFVPAIMNGERKWGPAPLKLGVYRENAGTDLRFLEEQLNEPTEPRIAETASGIG